MKYRVLAILIVFICIGCGADTDTEVPDTLDVEVPHILDTRGLEVQETPDPRRLKITFEVIFSSAPVNLAVDSKNPDFLDWEQHSNIVSLYFSTSKLICTNNFARPIPCPPQTLRLIRETPQGVLDRTYKCTFVWDTGRQHVPLEVVIPMAQAVYTPPQSPLTLFLLATPPSGDLAANGTITVYFDNDPGDVTASAGTVAGSGKSRTISGPFTPGALSLTLTWTNGDGSHTLNYTVTAPDNTPPEVTGGSVSDGELYTINLTEKCTIGILNTEIYLMQSVDGTHHEEPHEHH